MGMKPSTIKKILRHRLNEWLETITDEAVKKLANDNVIVCGGAIASMLLGEKVNDYDIYFRDKETTLAVANYYVAKFNVDKGNLKTTAFSSYNPQVIEKSVKNILGVEEDRIIVYMKSAGVAGETEETYQYFENRVDGSAEDFVESLDPVETTESLREDLKTKKRVYKPVFFTDNAITLSDKMQLVVRFYGEPDQIHSNYDFVHAMTYYDFRRNILEISQEAAVSLLSKNLIYRGSLYPIASLFRIRKFIERGWRISAGQMLKIIWQIKSVDFGNPAILREQLIGVDMAYMFELITEINKMEGRIDDTYIANLIDRIFE